MKPVRVALIVTGVVVALVLIALLIAFSTSFQTWAARRALAGQPDLRGNVGEVSAGWRHVEIRDLHLEKDGAVLTLPALDAELPLLAAGLRDRVLVRRLVAKGWTLDLSKLNPSAATHAAAAPVLNRGFSFLSSAIAAEPAAQLTAPAAARAFDGVFPLLQLPVDLALEEVVLQGEVILPPAAGQPAPRVKVSVTGGGLAAGRTGTFTVEAAAAQPDGGTLSLHSAVSAQMDTPRTFATVAMKSQASASGTQFPSGVHLDADLSAARKDTGEDYGLAMSSAGKPLADIKAEFLRAAARLNGTWKIDLHDADLRPFALGKPLPTFGALGEGTFETGTSFDEIRGRGSLKGSVDGLEVLQPELSAIGAVSFNADFDVLQHGDALRVEHLNALASAPEPVATVRALQSFEFNLKTAELRVADPAQDLVGVSFAGVPVGWMNPFLDGLRVSGGNIRGEFVAGAREGGLALRPRGPLELQHVSVEKEGEPLLRDVDISLTASADYTPAGWQAEIVRLDVRSEGAALFTLDAKAGQLASAGKVVKATGRWSADLPHWLSQPVLAGQLQLARGLAQGEFSASLDGTQALEAKINLTDLVGPDQQVMPTIGIEVRADIAPNGKATFNVPLAFTQGPRKSDLLIAGTLTPAGDVSNIDGRITGDTVYLDDVQLLLLLLPVESVPAEKPNESGGTEPFWNQVRGQVALSLKKVIYGADFVVSNMGGTLRIDAAALKFENVRAAFGPESDLKLDGGLSFNAQAAQGYALSADLLLNNFDTGPMFKAIDPAKLPTVEARVNVASHVSGRGATLGEVAERAQGRFQLSSKGGVFRALATVLPAERLQATQSALAIVGGLLGGSTGETVNSASEIVKMLSEISFDQLNLKAERDATLNLVLQDFTLISPNVRLGGAGVVTYVPGKPLLQQALDMQVSLGARGRLGELFGQLKMLKPEKDPLGYSTLTTPIKIGGTLASTDTSDLRTKLLNLALEKTGLEKILGGGK